MSTTTQPRTDVLGQTFAQFRAQMVEAVGYCDRFHRDWYRQILTTGRSEPHLLSAWQEAQQTAPGIIEQLQNLCARDQLPTIIHEYNADDPLMGRTRKLVLRLHDNKEVESVLIPMAGGVEKGGYATVCVSSQVGCRMGCRFCHTATMGLLRHLTADEIVAQVVAVKVHTGITPRNVVFMGMGEPLDNLDAVAQAIAVLSDDNGLGIPHRHITVSTVGRVDGIQRLPSLGLNKINLAVSLSAASDSLRSEIMPVNRLYNLSELHKAITAFPLPPNRKVLISYVLMAGVNDSEEQITALIKWCGDLPVLVNLIPLNPIPSRPDVPSSVDRIEAIHARMEKAGVHVRIRRTKGDNVMAACGQLGDPDMRKRLLKN